MAEWLIGYKIEEKTLGEMVVEVDQCNQREHYLYLFNEEEAKPIEVEEDVVSVEPESSARVLGIFSPGSWSYAVELENIKSLIEPPDDEEEN